MCRKHSAFDWIEWCQGAKAKVTISQAYRRISVCVVSWESFVGSSSPFVSRLPLLPTFPIPRREAGRSRWKVKGLLIACEEAWLYQQPPSMHILECTMWEGNLWHCCGAVVQCVHSPYFCVLSCSKCGTLPPESCFFSLICSTGSFMGKTSHYVVHKHIKTL